MLCVCVSRWLIGKILLSKMHWFEGQKGNLLTIWTSRNQRTRLHVSVTTFAYGNIFASVCWFVLHLYWIQQPNNSKRTLNESCAWQETSLKWFSTDPAAVRADWPFTMMDTAWNMYAVRNTCSFYTHEKWKQCFFSHMLSDMFQCDSQFSENGIDFYCILFTQIQFCL